MVEKIKIAMDMQPAAPEVKDGFEVQRVLDASYISAREERWVRLPITE